MSYPLAINKIRTEHLKFPEGGKFGQHVRGARPHYGWDLSASPGTSVFAVGPGTISLVAEKIGKYGTVIQLRFLKASREYWALYAHLSQTWVAKGDHVAEGQMIGSTGRTGYGPEEPPHLHFEIATDPNLRKGRHNYIDPSIVLGPFLKQQAAGQGVVRESRYEIDLEAFLRRANVG